MNVRVLVADDEPLARRLIRGMVSRDPELEIVGEAATGLQVLQQLEDTDADLLFLDVCMPGLDGMSALHQLRELQFDTHVVLVTASGDHAVEAYELQAADYLVKPVQRDRFDESVARAKRALRERAAAATQSPRAAPLRILTRDNLTLVRPETVVWVEAASQYARVHTQDAEFMISRPLADVATRLPPEHFIRVHRSALINRHFVRQIRRDRGGLRLLMAGGEEVAVSRSRKKQVLKRLEAAVEPLS